MKRPTFEAFKKKAFAKPGVKKTYEKLKTKYENKLKLIKMQKSDKKD
jgi:hypothetical protein